MRVVRVSGRDNAFQRFEVLRRNRNKRYKYNEFLVEGVRSLNEAVENGWRIKSFLYNGDSLSRWASEMIEKVDTEVNYWLTAELMDELSGKEDSSELMAVIEMREDRLDSVPLSDNPLIMLFDRPSNKGNLGTMIRSCDGLGADMLIITGHGVDLYDPDVVVAAMGSFFNMPVVRAVDNDALFRYIQELKERYPGFTVLGTTAHQERAAYSLDLTGSLMVMMGNETLGLNRAFKEACDRLCTIPMSQRSYASSFNVSCAASILLYEVARQRAGGR